MRCAFAAGAVYPDIGEGASDFEVVATVVVPVLLSGGPAIGPSSSAGPYPEYNLGPSALLSSGSPEPPPVRIRNDCSALCCEVK